MKLLSFVLAFTLLAAGAGVLLADDHGGPGNEAGSGSSEHPGHGQDAPSASPSPTTTPTASPSPAPAER